jgi:hypothetical protein
MFPNDLQRNMSEHDHLRRKMPIELTKQSRLDIIKDNFPLEKRVILQEDHGFDSISINIREALELKLTSRDVGRCSPELEQCIAGLLIQRLIRQLDLQLLQIIWQMRWQWLRIRPVNDFARHGCDNL